MTETGLRTRTCTRCGEVETEVIPVVTSGVNWEVDDYDLIIHNASNIDIIRLAPGYLTTSSEIRNAPGLRTFSSALVASLTDENGDLRIDLINEGEYSMWVRFKDQKSEIVNRIIVNPAEISPYVSDINGITIKIDGISSDVKDIFLAPGTLSTYRECNDNKIVRLYNLEGKRSVTYAIDYRNISVDGDYTMCVRYNSTGRGPEFSYFHLDYPQPEVTVHGLQITISGLQNIRTVRIASGVYTTASDVKKAPDVRLFSKNDKTLRDVANSNYTYTIQCKNDGNYTLSIEYIGGYIEIRTVNVRHLEPTVEIKSNKTITFGDLDDLNIIRFAPGKITTQGAFKRTAGNKYFKAKDIAADGTVTTPVLSGVWSFMIQYNELSYTIFTYDFDNNQYVK